MSVYLNSSPLQFKCYRTRPADICKENKDCEAWCSAGDPAEQALAPRFLSSAADLVAVAGEQVRLGCRVWGRPAPELIWCKAGRQVTQDDRHKILVNEQGSARSSLAQFARLSGWW